MRTILKCNRMTPIAYMLDRLHWLSIKRLQLNPVLAGFNIQMADAPVYLKNRSTRVGVAKLYYRLV